MNTMTDERKTNRIGRLGRGSFAAAIAILLLTAGSPMATAQEDDCAHETSSAGSGPYQQGDYETTGAATWVNGCGGKDNDDRVEGAAVISGISFSFHVYEVVEDLQIGQRTGDVICWVESEDGDLFASRDFGDVSPMRSGEAPAVSFYCGGTEESCLFSGEMVTQGILFPEAEPPASAPSCID